MGDNTSPGNELRLGSRPLKFDFCNPVTSERTEREAERKLYNAILDYFRGIPCLQNGSEVTDGRYCLTRNPLPIPNEDGTFHLYYQEVGRTSIFFYGETPIAMIMKMGTREGPESYTPLISLGLINLLVRKGMSIDSLLNDLTGLIGNNG